MNHQQRNIWILVAAVGLAFAGLSALLAFKVRESRRVARLHECEENLYVAGILLMSFDRKFNRLPPVVFRDESGKVLGSWRFAVMAVSPWDLPAFDLDRTWNSAPNSALANKPLKVFCFRGGEDDPNRLHTKIVAITGPGSAFEEDTVHRLEECPHDTILLSELANSETHWMAPGDLSIDNAAESLTAGLYNEGVHVLFADRAVWFLRKEVPFGELRKFFTLSGAEEFDRDEVLRPYVIKTYEGQ